VWAKLYCKIEHAAHETFEQAFVVCVCVRERERKREREIHKKCVCVYHIHTFTPGVCMQVDLPFANSVLFILLTLNLLSLFPFFHLCIFSRLSLQDSVKPTYPYFLHPYLWFFKCFIAFLFASFSFLRNACH
jgi:hypothetical protein